MADAAKSGALIGGKLKREDCNRTKHDSHFSRWQVLIGASDWADYLSGKEGAARYRVHNLPWASFAGVYELGIAIGRLGSSRGVEKHEIVVVYLGQAENVRTRLQRYGRTGAHLESRKDDHHPTITHNNKGISLFQEIFLRGHSIVFRWAAMKNKKAAEKTESELLNTFDYAWNRGGNGARRPDEILHKLDRISSSSTAAIAKLKDISKRLMSFGQAAVGIKIEAIANPQKLKTEDDADGINKFFARVFKFNRSKPRLVVSDSYRIPDDKCNSGNVCGFIMVDGIPCTIPPVVGRKRCQEHKGMRIYGAVNNTCSSAIKATTVEEDELSKFTTDIDGRGSQLNDKLCGAGLVNGSLCRRWPQKGNERCWQHQGNKIVNANANVTNDDLLFTAPTCGVPLLNGWACVRAPVPGRKRCLQHKGMRLQPSASR